MRSLFPALLLAASALAQPAPTPRPAPQPTPASPGVAAPTPAPAAAKQPASPADEPLPVRLGRRVERLRQAYPVAPVVVIVRDPASYIGAIARWRPSIRFPVLIDDGSALAREDIARFVRAYAPKQVVRWAAEGAHEAAWNAADPKAVAGAVAAAVGVGAEELAKDGMIRHWRAVESPGLICANEADPAWTAAIALSAGRAEPIFWVKPPGDLAGVMSSQEADDLCRTIEASAEATGLPWRALGDTLEAVTLCLNCPVKVQVNPREAAALTDRVGRLGSGEKAVERWAWAGQVVGSAPQAAYRAMSALFLAPTTAWVFDGYPDQDGWNTFDGTAASRPLRSAGMTVTLDDTPKQGARDWRLRVARPIDAGLVLVNTKGNADFFDLEPGQCKPGDIPMLTRPAMVHFVHSWSAQWPARRDTIAGRWLERGAYCYLGSVQEPFLQAFVPTPGVAIRLVAGAPFGAAVRLDDARMWKLAVLGDPLAVLGPALKRAQGEPDLPGAIDQTQVFGESLRAGKFAEALALLSLLGRDADAKALALTLLQQKPDQFTPAAAREAVGPLFRSGATREVIAAFRRLDDAGKADPLMRDYLWLAVYPLLEGSADDDLLFLLRDTLRPDNLDGDAQVLGAAWTRLHNRAEALAMLEALRQAEKDPARRGALEHAMSMFGWKK